DWFTVVAQAINFLILVWLLKRFLYKPILHAIDEREKGIAAQLAEAEAKQAEAQQERDDFQHKNEAFDQARAALLKKAEDEAKAERQRLLDGARKDADALRAKRQDALRDEQFNLGQEIARWTQKEVFAVARKTLADLATTSLEERMVDVFVHRLSALTGAAKEELVAALKASNQPARVRSAFDLPPAQRKAIESAVNEAFGAEAHIRFETAPELVSGIELSSDGQKVAWSIADYLATLEKSVGELLQKDTGPESKPDPKLKPEADAKAQPDPKVVARPKSSSVAKSEPTTEATPGPNREPQQVLESVPSTFKADH
ncbi:MAG TPA: F0F1 ATP synthase subunit delta, partial [Planctomycetaceae bacterium]|nr:F0F1 ATP synthase subunit delta [Planctomycetaceae bacterium]